LISLQQGCLANAWALTTEVGRHFLSRAFEGAHDLILLHSLVTGLRGGNGAACAAVPAAGYRMDRSTQRIRDVRTSDCRLLANPLSMTAVIEQKEMAEAGQLNSRTRPV
jgi:hypothetical protein